MKVHMCHFHAYVRACVDVRFWDLTATLPGAQLFLMNGGDLAHVLHVCMRVCACTCVRVCVCACVCVCVCVLVCAAELSLR
jgi:hypothetical protein